MMKQTHKYVNYKFNYYLNMRSNHKPIAHIVNSKYFWKYKFYINKSVLIPRPETEQLIEQSLKYIPVEKELNILDIGTGSGCLIVSLLKERPKCYATAIDLSKEALKVANAFFPTRNDSDENKAEWVDNHVTASRISADVHYSKPSSSWDEDDNVA